jgi:hypothetical protein
LSSVMTARLTQPPETARIFVTDLPGGLFTD